MGYSRFTIGLDSKTYERLRELKWISRRSISDLIEEMVKREITKYEEHYRWIDELHHREAWEENKPAQSCLRGKLLYRIKYKPNL
jgi:predicted CopG family antitoxin